MGEASADDAAMCPPQLGEALAPAWVPDTFFDPAAFDYLPLPAYVCDRDGLIRYCNAKAQALWEGCESIGRRYWGNVRLYTAQGAPLPSESSFIALCLREDREIAGVELLLERPSGERRRILAHAKPVHDAQGVLRGAVVVLDDVNAPLAAEQSPTLPLADLYDYVLQYDAEWRLVYVSDRVLEVLNASRESMLQRTIWELFPNVEESGYAPYLQRAVRERRAMHFEYYSDVFNGWFNNHLYPLSDGILILGEEVTERKRREQRQSILLDLIPAATYWCEAPSGRLRQYNKHAAELWGHAPDLVHNPPLYCGATRCYTPEGFPLTPKQLPHAQVLRDGIAVRNAELVIERADGSRITVLGTVEPIRDESDRVVGAVTVVQDISERIRAEEIRTHLAAIVASSNDAIISRDLHGIVTFWNAAAERLYGYRAEEMVGHPVQRLYPPERVDEEVAILQRILAGERIAHFETLRRHKDGSLLELSITLSPVHDRSGRIIGVSSVAHAIDERKRHERTLMESEERYRCLVEASGSIVFTADIEARWLRPVPAWELCTGQSYPEYCGHGWLDAIHPEDRIRLRSLMQESLQCQDAFQLEVRVWHRPSQSYRYHDARAVPIRTASGQVREWVGTATDIHARKLAEDQVRQADRRKDEFLAVLAHELRNPLAPIVTSLHILRMPDATDLHAQALEIMDRQLHHLVRLVDDLMEVARITSGTIELRKELLRLDEAIMAAGEISRPSIEARGHELSIALPPEPLKVHADRVRLTQIIANLLNNAARYTPPGGKLQIHVVSAQGEAGIHVIDNGVGIEAGQLERIFEMFTRAQPEGREFCAGLGIGLGLARRLAQLHGGRVEAYSAGRGQGSCFTLWLPLALALDAPMAPQMPLHGPLPRRRVLVVDDNRDAASSLAAVLKALGQDVQVVHDGAQAIATAAVFQPEVALLDLGMPAPDGFAVARALRQGTAGQALALVAVTGWGQDVDRQRSRDAGFDLHLVKPVALEDLRRALALKTP